MRTKTVLVTGALRGIGAEICHCFSANGYFVYLNYRKKDEHYERMKDAVISKGGNCEFLPFDVRNEKEIERAVKCMKHNQIDVLVNNAGLLKDNLVYQISEDDWQDSIATNFWGCVNTYHMLREKLLHSDHPAVISIGSISGVRPKKGQGAYSASKAMVIEWTKQMAESSDGEKVNFYAVSPGPVMTDMIKETKWYQDAEAIKRVPLGRFAAPAEIAELVALAADQKALFRNGCNIIADGGFTQIIRN